MLKLHRLLVAGLAILTLTATAQDYKGPVTLVVGYPAGGSADMGARILAEKLSPLLGQPVLVDNRAGAGGQIAARHVKDAPPNGSVLFFTNSHTVVTVPLVLKSPGFDTETDLKPVAPFASFEQVLVAHPKTQAKTVQALTEYFARTPSERSIGVPAPASQPDFAVRRLAQLWKIDVQPVAYRGSAPATQDLLGGQISAAYLPVADVLPYYKAGRLNVLAITQATPLMPGIPAFGDVGLAEVSDTSFLAVYAPAGMSDANVARFGNAVRRVLAMPDVVERLAAHVLSPLVGTPADLTRLYTTQRAAARSLIRAVNYQPE